MKDLFAVVLVKGENMSEPIEPQDDPKDKQDPPSDPPKDLPADPPKQDPGMAKALADLQKYKAKVQELETAREQDRINKLRESEKWKELAEEYRTKAEEFENKNKTLSQSMIFDKKYSAVKAAALAAGLRKEAISDLELIDLDGVDIETTSTGRVNVLNVEKAVEDIKATRPHWFGRKGSGINSTEPDVVSGGEIKYDDIVKAEEKAKKTGDYAPYKSLLMRFQEQQNRR